MTSENTCVQKTHLRASVRLVGKVEKIKTGKSSTVVLLVHPQMRVDEMGLIHGGFTFGLADYAAMVAVNDPYVVLLSSQANFLKPVRVGDRLTARACITETAGKKKTVHCDVFNQAQQKVFSGTFLCLTLSQHILEKEGK